VYIYVYSVYRLYYKTQVRVVVSSFAPRTRTMHTDIEEPATFDRTPLTAAFAGAVGRMTPFSPERTVLSPCLDRGNPGVLKYFKYKYFKYVFEIHAMYFVFCI